MKIASIVTPMDYVLRFQTMKEYPETISLEEIWKYFEGFPLAHLATVEGDRPRVRPMSLITHNDELWLATKTSWAKVNHIRKKKQVEFSVAPISQEGTGSIRCTAEAIIVEDHQLKSEVESSIPWFRQYWSDVKAPNFTLIRLELKRILFDHPSDRKKYTVILT
jgi:general stress protein 26